MSALNILIVGAGVAGPALAILLQRSNPAHTITVVERWPDLRAAGQQIDLKVEGLKIMRRMGLLEAMEAKCVKETGMEVFDMGGRSLGRFGVGAGDERYRRALTTEHEIMRGDMVRVLYDAGLEQNAELKRRAESQAGESGAAVGGLTYEFGTTVTELSQFDGDGDGDNAGVDVTLSDGRRRRFDLVVAADGLGSRTRRLAFGREANDAAFRSIGVHAAYYDVPRDEEQDDVGLAAMHSAPGRRMVHTRTSGRPRTQVLLLTMADDTGALARSYRADVAAQKRAFTQAFAEGAGWRTPRLLAGMRDTDDFYASELGQIHMRPGDGYSRGRVVLLGDAGYCPSPFTGMGTETCLVGAYALAGELARRGPGGAGIAEALRAYEAVVRPAVEDMQALPRPAPWVFPSSAWGVCVLTWIIWIAAKIDQFMSKPRAEGSLGEEEKKEEEKKKKKKELEASKVEKMGFGLPDYPELNLES